jgi:diguanylate cyclase (GGDEF)-like protein
MDQSFQSLTAAVLEAKDFREMAGPMLEALQRLAAVEAAYITRVEPETGTQRILGARHRHEVLNQAGDTLEWRHSLCAYALACGEILIPNTSARWPEAVGSATHGVRRYVCYPIQTDDGRLFGTLCGLDRYASAASTSDLRAVLALFAGLLTKELQRESVAEEAPPGAAASRALEPQDLALLDRFLELGHQAQSLQAMVTDLARLERERGRWPSAVPFYCIEGDPQASWVEENPIVAHIAGVLADHDAETTDSDSKPSGAALALDANLIATQRLRVEAGLRARGTSVLVRVSTPTGLQGGIILLDDSLTPLRYGESWLLSHAAEQLSLIAERLDNQQALAEARTRLEQSATRDNLTGLRNRRYLIEELDRILAQADRLGETIHVAFINLDGFKAINDRHGHEAGDQLLLGIAQRLQQATRASDIVARYGGDEFVVVGPGIRPAYAEHERKRFGERLHEATHGHYDLAGIDLDYDGPSIGVTTTEPGDLDPDRILAMAEEAMYAIKEERRWSRRAGKTEIG